MITFWLIVEFSNVLAEGVSIKVQGFGPVKLMIRQLINGKLNCIVKEVLHQKIKEMLLSVVKDFSMVDQLYIHILQRRLSTKK